MSSDQATPEAQTTGLPPTPVSANSTEKKKGKAPAKPKTKPKTKAAGGISKTEALLWDIATHAEKIDFAGMYEKHGYANAKSMRDSFLQMKNRYLKTVESKNDGDENAADAADDDEDAEDEDSPAPTPANKSVKRKTVKEEDSEEKAVKKPRKTKAKAAVSATEEA